MLWFKNVLNKQYNDLRVTIRNQIPSLRWNSDNICSVIIVGCPYYSVQPCMIGSRGTELLCDHNKNILILSAVYYM